MSGERVGPERTYFQSLVLPVPKGKGKVKAIHITGLDRPRGFQEV